MEVSTWIVASIVVGVALLVLVLGVRLATGKLSRNWTQHRAETVEAWQAEGIEFVKGPAVCQFGGLDSLTPGQLERGPGYVVLTPQDLRVSRMQPSESWIVPLRQIKSVSLARSYRGKVVNQTPYIIVKFKNDGQTDNMAFQVKEFKDWATTLAGTAGVTLKDKSGA